MEKFLVKIQKVGFRTGRSKPFGQLIMKKIISVTMLFSIFCSLCFTVALVNSTKTTTFYVDTLVRCDVVAQNGQFLQRS